MSFDETFFWILCGIIAVAFIIHNTILPYEGDKTNYKWWEEKDGKVRRKE